MVGLSFSGQLATRLKTVNNFTLKTTHAGHVTPVVSTEHGEIPSGHVRGRLCVGRVGDCEEGLGMMSSAQSPATTTVQV